MHVRFADADQNFISSQAEQGFYSNETEVVRDAVRRLRELKEAQTSGFYRAALKGHEQIEQGLTIPYSRELIEQIAAQSEENVKSGKKINYNKEVIVEND